MKASFQKEPVDYTVLDQKIKGGLLILQVKRLECEEESLLDFLTRETTTEAETLTYTRALMKVKKELVNARLDLELLGIEVNRPK